MGLWAPQDLLSVLPLKNESPRSQSRGGLKVVGIKCCRTQFAHINTRNIYTTTIKISVMAPTTVTFWVRVSVRIRGWVMIRFELGLELVLALGLGSRLEVNVKVSARIRNKVRVEVKLELGFKVKKN